MIRLFSSWLWHCFLPFNKSECQWEKFPPSDQLVFAGGCPQPSIVCHVCNGLAQHLHLADMFATLKNEQSLGFFNQQSIPGANKWKNSLSFTQNFHGK
jgi:hypothetical protein